MLFIIFVLKIRNVLIVFLDHLNVETFFAKWDDGKITEIEAKLEELRHFNARFETSPDKDWGTLHSRNTK